MLEKISKLDSQVLRALLVVAIGLTGSILRAFGVGTDTFNKTALEIADQALLFIAAVGAVYAAYARISKPNPPLSDAAIRETQRLLDEGKLKDTPTEGEETE